MGKVKDGMPASKPSKPPKGTQVAQSKRRLAPFFANLVRANLYKPKQGRWARRSTEIALGVVLALGLWRLHETLYSLRARRSGSASRAPSGWCSAG